MTGNRQKFTDGVDTKHKPKQIKSNKKDKENKKKQIFTGEVQALKSHAFEKHKHIQTLEFVKTKKAAALHTRTDFEYGNQVQTSDETG